MSFQVLGDIILLGRWDTRFGYVRGDLVFVFAMELKWNHQIANDIKLASIMHAMMNEFNPSILSPSYWYYTKLRLLKTPLFQPWPDPCLCQNPIHLRSIYRPFTLIHPRQLCIRTSPRPHAHVFFFFSQLTDSMPTLTLIPKRASRTKASHLDTLSKYN